MSDIITSVHGGRIMIDDGCDSIDIAVSDWDALKAAIDRQVHEGEDITHNYHKQ